MTLTSPPRAPTPGCGALRERHFAGGVQEKKRRHCTDLNTNETKSVDGRRDGVIAPSRSRRAATRRSRALTFTCGCPGRSRAGRARLQGREVFKRTRVRLDLTVGSFARCKVPDAKPTLGDPVSPIWRVPWGLRPRKRGRGRHGTLLHSLWITCGDRHRSWRCGTAVRVERFDVAVLGQFVRGFQGSTSEPRLRARLAGLRCLSREHGRR
jgi:hypothetical protein